MESHKEEYKKMVYDRDYIQNASIKEELSRVTGISVANLDKILLD